MARKGRRATYEERVRAVQMLEDGYSADVVAERFDVGRTTVFDWQRKYRDGGWAGVATKSASGRPTALSEDQMATLYTLIVGYNPRQLGFGVALWTREVVADLMERQFGVRLVLVTVGRILRRLGLSPQRPLYRAYQQDPTRVQQWVDHEYPAIRAEAHEMGAAVFFADEAAIRTDHHAGTTWAPVGQTPVVTATGERKSVQLISAISPRGDVHFDVHEGRMNAGVFIEFCQQLVASVDRPIFLVVDGSSAHTAKKVQRYVASTDGWLRLFFLPPYAPELNPDEWVWNNVKNARVGRHVPRSKDEMRAAAIAALQRLQAAPHIVRGFFSDPALAYIHQ